MIQLPRIRCHQRPHIGYLRAQRTGRRRNRSLALLLEDANMSSLGGPGRGHRSLTTYISSALCESAPTAPRWMRLFRRKFSRDSARPAEHASPPERPWRHHKQRSFALPSPKKQRRRQFVTLAAPLLGKEAKITAQSSLSK